ncbi:MAG TPA: hypothetical protein VGF68_17525 [Solirubrobacteraceae bacterium]|jgi:hypothetical protein
MREVDRRQRLEVLFDEHAAAVRAYALPWLLACARRVLANQYRGARRRLALVDRLSSGPRSIAPGRFGVAIFSLFRPTGLIRVEISRGNSRS